jgi:hypothetical protein
MSTPEPATPAIQDVVTAPNVTPIRGRTSTALAPVPHNETALVPANEPGKILSGLTERAPAIWSERRPSLAEIREYGRNGQYTGENGAIRRLGQAYAWFVLMVTAGGYYVLWVIQHPARLAVATVIATLFALTLHSIF